MQIEADNIIILVVSITLIFLIAGVFLLVFVNLYNEKKGKFLREATSLQQQFADTLLMARMEIREQTLRQVGFELHDNIGQIASLIKINLNALNLDKKEDSRLVIDEIKTMLREMIADIKAISQDLITDRVATAGLLRTIEADVNRISRSGQFKVALSVGSGEPDLAPETKVILYRMVQEMLNNTIKHSRASEINVETRLSGTEFSIFVRDNGVGYDPELVSNCTGSGLHTLIHRARMIGSDLSIDSEIGKGSNIRITTPLAYDGR